ncbi:MAG: hypothetical protein GY925_22070, partial [Actinomycetia bacterium]|nr:hypothetical protein [Actinomycetes bacterium]
LGFAQVELIQQDFDGQPILNGYRLDPIGDADLTFGATLVSSGDECGSFS